MTHIWTFEYEDEVQDLEFNSKGEALKAAQEFFNDEHVYSEVSVEGEAHLILFDDETRIVDQRERVDLFYEPETDDKQEHGVWHSGGGGVL